LTGVRGSFYGFQPVEDVWVPFQCSVGGSFDLDIKNLFRLEGDVSYNEIGPVLKGSLTTKLLNTGALGWQAIGTTSASIDFRQYVKFEGSTMEGTLGNGYIYNGSRSMTFTWNPSYSLIGQGSGSVSIPKVYSSGSGTFSAIADYLNSYLPIQLGGVETYLRVAGTNGVFKANVTFPIIGSAHVVVNLSSPSIDFGRGTVPLGIAHPRGKDIPSSLVLDTVRIPANMAFAVVRIRSNGTPGASTLIDPSGVSHTVSTSDSFLGYRIDDTTRHGFWAIRNPKPGMWVLSMPQRTATDTIDAEAEPIEEPLHFAATQSGKHVTVVWTPLSTTDTAAVDIFLDDSVNIYKGFRIASAEDNAGTVTFDLADSLPQCVYYLYAARDNGAYVSESYSPDPLDNSKSSVSAPSGLTAQYRTGDTVFLRWDPVSTATGYVVRVSDTHGHDSAYASVPSTQDSIALVIPNARGEWISVLSSKLGIQSCWSNSVAATSGIAEPEVQKNRNDLGLQFWPNPAKNNGELSFTLHGRESVIVSLFDLLGNTVMTPVAGTFDPGTHSRHVDLNKLTPGTYYCRIRSGSSIETVKVVIE
jgi:hypothetical protein